MDKKTEETMLKIADYNNNEKMIFSKKLRYMFLAGLVAYIVYMAIDILKLMEIQLYSNIADFALGLVLADLLLGVLYSSHSITKIKSVKMRLLNRIKQ